MRGIGPRCKASSCKWSPSANDPLRRTTARPCWRTVWRHRERILHHSGSSLHRTRTCRVAAFPSARSNHRCRSYGSSPTSSESLRVCSRRRKRPPNKRWGSWSAVGCSRRCRTRRPCRPRRNCAYPDCTSRCRPWTHRCRCMRKGRPPRRARSPVNRIARSRTSSDCSVGRPGCSLSPSGCPPRWEVRPRCRHFLRPRRTKHRHRARLHRASGRRSRLRRKRRSRRPRLPRRAALSGTWPFVNSPAQANMPERTRRRAPARGISTSTATHDSSREPPGARAGLRARARSRHPSRSTARAVSQFEGGPTRDDIGV